MFSSTIIRRVSVAVATFWLVAIVVGGVVSAQRLRAVLKAADAPQTALFDHGLSALDPRAPVKWTNESCAVCHQAEFDQWKKSRHAVAGVNDNFRAQFLDADAGRQQWCLNCHAPINHSGDLLPTQEPNGIDDAFREKPYWLARGVDCITCHVRDGRILVTQITKEASRHHPLRLAPELGTADFCAGCHQFAAKVDALPDGFSGRLQQASLEEFHDFHAAGGGVKKCQECHMPSGDHLMPGGYSISMIKSALDLQLSAEWTDDDSESLRATVGVSADGVGHRLPGGEHFFRFLTVRALVQDADGQPVFFWPEDKEIGWKLGPFEHGLDPHAQPTSDTRLIPGQVRRYKYDADIDGEQFKAPFQFHVELWYHIMNQSDAVKFGIPTDEVEHLILSKTITLAPREDR